MPEPFTLALLCIGKLVAGHTVHATAANAAIGGAAAGGATTAGSAHIAALLFAGVAVGTTLYAICVCLEKLVKAGVFSQKQAEAYKKQAKNSSEATKKEMLRDAKALCEKYGLKD